MTARRLIFINPPSPFLVNDRGAPPLGILWLAAEVRQQGYEPLVWDMTGDTHLAAQFGCDGDRFISLGNIWLPGWIEQCSDDTIFAITCTSAQYNAARNLLTALKWVNPHWRVIIGGSHASALPHETFADGFDTVFAGECDHALPQWLDGILVGGVVEGLAPRDLDALPFPARDLVDLKSYCSDLTVGDGFSSTILMTRGCVFNCAYCVRTLGDAARLLRVRSIASILSEIHAMDDHYRVRRWVAVDDIWGVKRPWLQEFCDVFAGERYHFRVNCRANTLHYDLLLAMKRAGIDCISFGFESGSEHVLSAISKNNVALNTKAVHACHEAGIAVKAYLMFGFAEDNHASLEATRRWIEEARPDSAQCAWVIPLPGTPIYEQAIAAGWHADYSTLYHNGRDRRGGMSRLPWHTDETAALYEDLCRWLEDFYQHPQPTVECPNALTPPEAS